MEWIAGNIITTSEAVDAVGEMLSEAGISGFWVEDTEEMQNFLNDNPQSWDYIDDELLNKKPQPPLIKFYVPDNAEGLEIIIQVKSEIKRLKENDYGLDFGPLSLELINVDDTEWLNNWKKYYKPFQIGNGIIIRPFWEEYDNKEGKLVFTINPGHVFGTGLHQSTRICVEALEKLVIPGQSVLDLGCGSGILGIIALMLGAKNAALIDIDPAAKGIVRENAELNGITPDKYLSLSGNILTDYSVFNKINDYAPNKYDIIISNIVADVIISLAPYVARLIAPGGYYLTSGIIDERLDDVLFALNQNGFTKTEVVSLEGWAGVTCVFSQKI